MKRSRKKIIRNHLNCHYHMTVCGISACTNVPQVAGGLSYKFLQDIKGCESCHGHWLIKEGR